jgi:hypothetical protein
MRKRTTALMLSGALATGVVGAAALTPASAATSSNPISSRLAHLKADLSGLVGDGTLTQAQADKVASTLDAKLPKRPGGPGFGRGFRHDRGLMRDEAAAAAKTLGLSEAALRTQLESGKSLADVAKAQNVDVATLVKALVAVAQDHLDAAVKAGRLTQARADELSAKLTTAITQRVSHVRPAPGSGPMGAPGADFEGGPPPAGPRDGAAPNA